MALTLFAVQTGGSKLWRLRYRFAGKENTLWLGSFPEVSLASAREKRDAARRGIATGKIRPSKRSSTSWQPWKARA